MNPSNQFAAGRSPEFIELMQIAETRCSGSARFWSLSAA
jgi:hypothetical protein